MHIAVNAAVPNFLFALGEFSFDISIFLCIIER